MAKKTGEDIDVLDVEVGFKLPKKTITIKPIERGNQMIKNPEHVGYFMYPDTEITLILPRKLSNNSWKECMTEEERKFVENELKEDLSFRANNKFWSTRKIKIKKTESLMRTGQKLDLSNIDDYIDYCILKVQPIVSPSWEERLDSAEYRFALVEDGEVLHKGTKTADTKLKAFEVFTKMQHSKEKLVKFLQVFGKNVDINQSLEFLRSEVYNIVDLTPSKFVDVIEEPNYESKAFIYEAMRYKGLKVTSRNTYCLNFGQEDVIGRTLQDAIDYIKDAKNSNIILEIQAIIDRNKKQK